MFTIDLDSHLRDEYFLDEIYNLEGEFADKTPKKIASGKYPIDNKFEYSFFAYTEREEKSYNHNWIYHPDNSFMNGQMAENQIGGYDMETRLKHNEIAKVDRQLIFPTGITSPATAPGPLGAALARCYNNWVKELVRGNEDTLWPVGIMPAGHPEAMAAEAEYCVKELGFKALHMAPFTQDRTVDDEAFHPFYATAEKLNVPLFAHPNSRGPSQSMFKTFTQIHALGRPFNSCMALIGLVLGGVFDKFPNLKVVFFECTAEWPLYWMHRMDDDHKFTDQAIFKDHGMGSIEHYPSYYMRKNCWYSCESDEGAMTQTIEELGADRIVFASDYPHFDSEYPNTVPDLIQRNDISPKDKEMIFSKNAEVILNI